MSSLSFRRRGRLHCILDNERGAAAIEFAFIAPLLIILTIGIIDLGRLFFAVSSFKHGVSEAARFASIRGAESSAPVSEKEVIALVQKSVVGVHPDRYKVAIVWDPNANAGSRVTVSVNHNFNFLIGGFLPLGSLDVSQSSTMTIP